MLPITIRNVRIFDGTKVLEDRNAVTINANGLITFEPSEAATTIEGTGMTLLPGLWDTHVHLSDPSPQSTENSIPLLQALAKHGITTAVDCGRMDKQQYDYIRSRDDLPDVHYAGNFATCTGSIHSKFQMSDPSCIVDNIDQANEFVARRVEQGADFVKIVADSPVGPSQEVINQLSKMAGAHGKRTMVHAARKRAFEMALSATPNVDIITHAPLDVPLTAEDAKQMAAAKVTAVPTLVMEQALSRAGFIPGAKFGAAIESIQQLRDAGVSILVGTDSNRSFINVKHGETFDHEVDLLVEAGMQPVEILNAATELSAKCFRREDRGIIAEGMRADLVLVGGDPTKDIKALREVKKVWKGGREIYPVLSTQVET